MEPPIHLRLMKLLRLEMHSGKILSLEPTPRLLDGTIMVLQFKEAPHHQKLFSGKDHLKWVKAIQQLRHSGVTMRNQSQME